MPFLILDHFTLHCFIHSCLLTAGIQFVTPVARNKSLIFGRGFHAFHDLIPWCPSNLLPPPHKYPIFSNFKLFLVMWLHIFYFSVICYKRNIKLQNGNFSLMFNLKSWVFVNLYTFWNIHEKKKMITFGLIMYPVILMINRT